jgi:myo-inositol-1(or 4)-monophosphatase
MSVQLTTTDLESILAFTVALARTAGDLILEGSDAIQSVTASKDVNEKKNSVDLVTEYDVRVEELVKKELANKYPTFQLCVDFLLSRSHLCI